MPSPGMPRGSPTAASNSPARRRGLSGSRSGISRTGSRQRSHYRSTWQRKTLSGFVTFLKYGIFIACVLALIATQQRGGLPAALTNFVRGLNATSADESAAAAAARQASLPPASALGHEEFMERVVREVQEHEKKVKEKGRGRERKGVRFNRAIAGGPATVEVQADPVLVSKEEHILRRQRDERREIRWKVKKAAEAASEKVYMTGGGTTAEVTCDECHWEVKRLKGLKKQAWKEKKEAARLAKEARLPRKKKGRRGRALLSRREKRSRKKGRVKEVHQALRAELDSVNAQIAETKQNKMDLERALLLLESEVGNIRDMLEGRGEWEAGEITKRAFRGSVVMLSESCDGLGRERRMLHLRAGTDRRQLGRKTSPWKGYSCGATPSEIVRYLEYKAHELCPDDWYFVQSLVYFKDCYALPVRRCYARTPQDPLEPVPLPGSLFDQKALEDKSVRWANHQCKSFECLNTRSLGDCRNCFNMSLEEGRWQVSHRGNIRMADVIAMKNGSLRIGLDAGGGTGSFAAHMARHGVTIMTTAMDYETVKGRHGGMPYFETIALRGLIPLFVPHKSRLPFFDNTLDVIHNVNTIKYMPILEFQELIYEWDRVLRPGGVMWFEMFYTPIEEMPLYVVVLELMNYKKLFWNLFPKSDRGEKGGGAHIYLNCVLEKPARPDGDGTKRRKGQGRRK